MQRGNMRCKMNSILEKNNLKILGVDEEEGEDLELKFITLIKENLDEEVNQRMWKSSTKLE